MNILHKWLKLCKEYQIVIKAICFSILPLFCCIITCRMQGYGIGDVYLPASEWNDELFYFKQVEGIVNYGYPYGYFGFNESRAEMLSFAAWSPVLVFPWILYGLVFGWDLLSPVYCNILLMGIAMFVFVMLVRPGRKQLGVLALLFVLFTPFTRYMLSGMPEVICFSLLIVFYSVSYSYLENGYPEGRKHWKLAALFALSAVLTLMRPYMIVFLLLPCYLWIRRCRWWGAGGSVAVVGITGGMYAAINHFLGAEYFDPLFNTDWVSAFMGEGVFAGTKYVVGRLWRMGKEFLFDTVEGFSSGWATGAFFGGFLVVMGILLWQTVVNIRSKDKNQALLNGHLAFCFTGMLAALLLMYKMTEGSKHLLTFIAVGIFAISMMDTRFYKKAVLAGTIFAYLYSYQAAEPYDYQIPFRSQEQEDVIGYWQGILTEQMVLDKSDKPSYDNVMIWTFSDTTENGHGNFDWQILYALPEGFGISCCRVDYITDQFDSLQSRYLAAPSGGTVDAMCAQAGWKEMGRKGSAVVYQRY